VKDVEVGVFDPSVVEIRRREGSSVKRGRVLASILAANTN